MSDLVVAVFVTEGGSAASTVESVRASAEHHQARVDPMIVSTTVPPDPRGPAAAKRMELFPLGAGYAKTRVLEAASAPAVAFLDDTVRVAPEWVSAVLRALSRSATAAVLGPVRPDEPEACGSAEAALIRRAFKGTAQASNIAVDRDRAVAAGGFPIRLEPAAAPYEDLALIAHVRRRGWAVEWDPAVAVDRVSEPPGGVDPAALRGYEVGRAIRHSHGRLATPCARVVVRHPGSVSPAAAPGLLRGLSRPRPSVSPTSFLKRLSPSMARRIEGEVKPLPASPPPKTHLMYDVGGRMLLHLHVSPSPRLRRSLEEREQIRLRTGEIEGIPKLHGTQFAADAAWFLEDRLPGAHPSPGDPERWFEPVARWAVRLAGPPGPPLGTLPEWREHRADLVAEFPEHEESLQVLTALDAMPSRHMHGDFQRRNVLLSGPSVGVVDWEGAWLYGIPGLDLVFLSLLARSDLPDPGIIDAVIAERDPRFGSLLPYLADAGAPISLVRPLLVAMLATWAVGEERRIRRTRTTTRRRPFRDLLDEFLPRLTA